VLLNSASYERLLLVGKTSGPILIPNELHLTFRVSKYRETFRGNSENCDCRSGNRQTYMYASHFIFRPTLCYQQWMGLITLLSYRNFADVINVCDVTHFRDVTAVLLTVVKLSSVTVSLVDASSWPAIKGGSNYGSVIGRIIINYSNLARVTYASPCVRRMPSCHHTRRSTVLAAVEILKLS